MESQFPLDNLLQKAQFNREIPPVTSVTGREAALWGGFCIYESRD
jgi:hypothetical protein